MLMGLISAPFAGIVVAVLLSMFIDNNMIAIAAGVIVCLLVVYSTVFSDNVSFEIAGTKFRYYKGKNLVKEYELIGAALGYNVKQSNSTDRVDLYINEDTIDCAGIGWWKFQEMFADMESISGANVQKIKTGIKE